MPAQLITATLSDAQSLFARAMAQGSSPIEAATLAGYSDPRSSAWLCLRNEMIVKAIRVYQYNLICTEGVSVSYSTAISMLQDPDCPPSIKLAAADRIFRMAGLDDKHPGALPHPKGGIGESNSPPALDFLNMSITEIESVINKLQAIANVTSSQLIDVTPTQPKSFWD